MLPEGHEREALARLVELQASNDLLDRPLAAVDLRLPDKMVIRQRSELPKEPAAPARKST
jgi:cell division protein FtsQ